MKTTIANIWEVPAYLPYLQPTITIEIIKKAESQLGVILPRAYLNLLAQQNGGYVRLTLPNSPHSKIWGVGPHFPSIIRECWWRDPAASEDDCWLPNDAKALVPFDGDGHWYLCFDYRLSGVTEEPVITYLDLETEREQRIAPNFEGFLELLTLDIDRNTIGIVANASIATVTAALQSAMSVKFDDLGSSDHGYPVQRGTLGRDDDPQWVWLSPNRVPRGFVRPSDHRYAELVNSLPGTGLRMPEHAEVEFIIECTSGVADRVKSACARASLRTVAIDRED